VHLLFVVLLSPLQNSSHLEFLGVQDRKFALVENKHNGHGIPQYQSGHDCSRKALSMTERAAQAKDFGSY
jgi:hypothetical protein